MVSPSFTFRTEVQRVQMPAKNASGALLVECEPHRRAAPVRQMLVLGKARERHHAAAFNPKPAAPMRGADVAHIGNAGIGIPALQRKKRRGHAPPRHGQLAAVRLAAHDRSRVIRKDSGQRRQVARPIMQRARKLSDGLLTLCYRVQIAQFDSSLMTVWSPLGHKVWSMSFAMRPLLYLPIALVQVLGNGASNLVLLLLGQRSSRRGRV